VEEESLFARKNWKEVKSLAKKSNYMEMHWPCSMLKREPKELRREEDICK
jgi:hypothetical protein